MPPVELILAFITATLLFAYMPGPALLYAAAQTVARGRRAGFMAAFGIHLGGYIHVIAAAAGLSVVFQAVPTLFLVVKVAGAAYLLWLGVRMVRSSFIDGDEDGDEDGRGNSDSEVNPLAAKHKSARRAFVESVAVELLNPKTALFFIAFLPQFADPANTMPIWTQMLFLGVVVNLVFASADILCVCFASAIVSKMQNSNGAAQLMQRLGGAILIGLGVKLALQRNV